MHYSNVDISVSAANLQKSNTPFNLNEHNRIWKIRNKIQ